MELSYSPESKPTGARKRKPTTISKISVSGCSSPVDERASPEPNNNKIASILSELKFAKQRNIGNRRGFDIEQVNRVLLVLFLVLFLGLYS